MIKHVWLEVNGLHEWNTTDEYVEWKKNGATYEPKYRRI